MTTLDEIDAGLRQPDLAVLDRARLLTQRCCVFERQFPPDPDDIITILTEIDTGLCLPGPTRTERTLLLARRQQIVERCHPVDPHNPTNGSDAKGEE